MSSNITIIGNLTRDPEVKFLPSGQAQTRLGIAVNKRWMNKQTQEWEERTSFFDVSVYGPLAENSAESLAKGMRVIVTGALEQRSWDDKDGNKRSAVEIKADAIGPDLSFSVATLREGSGRKKPSGTDAF